MPTNTPFPIYLDVDARHLIDPENRQIADALIAAGRYTHSPELRESLQLATAVFTSQPPPRHHQFQVAAAGGGWPMNLAAAAHRLATSGRTNAAPETVAGRERDLLDTVRELEPEIHAMNHDNFRLYLSQPERTLSDTILFAQLAQLAVHDHNAIGQFSRFRVFATPEETDTFFRNFLRMAGRVCGTMAVVVGPLRRAHAVTLEFLRACQRLHDDAFHARAAYARVNVARYSGARDLSQTEIGLFLGHLAAHGEEEGLQTRRLAFAMGTHPRLGAGSVVRTLAGFGDLAGIILRASE